MSRLKLSALLPVWAVVLLVAAPSSGADRSRRPNVIVIVADDLGYADLGIHGCRDIPTPHIDSLAHNGVRCTNGYVSHPYCSPTRAGLLTGRYQQRFGHEYNPGPATDRRAGVGLPLSEKTMADYFKAAGYATGIVGKWHLGHTEAEYHPLRRGFDEFFGFLGGAHSYLRSGTGNTAIFRDEKEFHEKAYLTDAFVREGVAFIEEHADEPFFLYWPFNAVHGPMEANEKDSSRFPKITDEGRRTYASMLATLDDAIGKGLEALRQGGIEDDTLIFFISDNGGPAHVNSSNNDPFRGGKATTFEGGIRVPFLVQWKGQLPAGRIYEEPVIQLDILPTALAASGIEVESDAKFDGVSLLPWFAGDKKKPPHEALYWRIGEAMAIRKGDWKLLKSSAGVRQKKSEKGGPAISGQMLFNLSSDMGEQTDLAAAHPEKIKELQAAWQTWSSELAEPRWKPDGGRNRQRRRNRSAAG